MTTPFIPSMASREGCRRDADPPSNSRESSGSARWALAGMRKWQKEIDHIRTLPYERNGERWPATIPAWRGFRSEGDSFQSGEPCVMMRNRGLSGRRPRSARIARETKARDYDLLPAAIRIWNDYTRSVELALAVQRPKERGTLAMPRSPFLLRTTRFDFPLGALPPQVPSSVRCHAHQAYAEKERARRLRNPSHLLNEDGTSVEAGGAAGGVATRTTSKIRGQEVSASPDELRSRCVRTPGGASDVVGHAIVVRIQARVGAW